MTLLEGIEERARKAAPPRNPAWGTIMVSPEAVVFHTPEQLREFVRAEIMRSHTLGHIPATRK